MSKSLARIGLGLLAAVGVVAGGVWLLTLALADRDTLFEGKPVEYWNAQAASADPSASNRANLVLNRVIIPHLTRVLFNDTNDSALKMSLVEKLNALPGVNVSCTPTEGRRSKAAEDIGSFGPAARQAIPALVQACQGNDPVIRGPAALALGKIHEQPDLILPLLTRYEDDQDINAEAAEALGDYGPAARAAVPKLVPLLSVHDKELHHAVMVALKQIDPEAAAQAGIR